jgi:DNA-binding XRE family transcriptional regulator
MEGVLVHNTVRKTREKLLMTKTELARVAGISPLTVDRIEKGMSCRIETKRKIILAFGYNLSDKGLIFKNR